MDSQENKDEFLKELRAVLSKFDVQLEVEQPFTRPNYKPESTIVAVFDRCYPDIDLGTVFTAESER